MIAVAIPAVKRVVRSSSISELTELAERAIVLPSAPEVRALITDYLASREEAEAGNE